jgi:hypothetical protein
LVQALAAHDVAYVVVGSVGARLYGVELEPNDFDIVPGLEEENLRNLTQALLDLEGSLPDTMEVGRWEFQADGERRWIARKATQAERRRRASWVPRSDDVSTLDHLIHTRHGNLDVVPSVAGEFSRLRVRARSMKVGGHEIWVAHIDDLLSALTVPRRPKYVRRVKELRDIQRQGAGR